jgi:hypothetical protein
MALARVPTGALVILASDPNQIPSVGSGNVLTDLLDIAEVAESNRSLASAAIHSEHRAAIRLSSNRLFLPKLVEFFQASPSFYDRWDVRGDWILTAFRNSFNLSECPCRTCDNSPAFQRRVKTNRELPNPEGTADNRPPRATASRPTIPHFNHLESLR